MKSAMPTVNQPKNSAQTRTGTMRRLVFPTARAAAHAVAGSVADLIRSRQLAGRPAVLGLPTGSTPVPLYEELVRLHRQEGLGFWNVITFNLDEYFPMSAGHSRSYHRYMQNHLFDHVDILPRNIHLLDGTVPESAWDEHCHDYEHKIHDAGGIDLQILGIGRTGHIGFNEPGSSKHSRTRLVNLDPITLADAAKVFGGPANVPDRALTMGVGTILEARSILMMAWGRGKAPILRKAFAGPIDTHIPASFLQEHPDATVVLDEPAADELAAAGAIREHPARGVPRTEP